MRFLGETGLKNVNSRDSYRFFGLFDSRNLILRTRTSVPGNLKKINYEQRQKQKQEKRECTLCLEVRGSPIFLRKLCFPTR